jgi:signal transduction histidine kinase
VVLARDLGLWTGLSVVVLAESGARDDPFWMRGACLLTLAAAVWSRRSRPLLALALVGGAEIVILVVALGSTIGVPIALVPSISLMSYLAGRRSTRLRDFVLLLSWGLVALLVLGVTVRRQVPVAETVLSWLLIALLSLLLVVLPWLIGRYRAQQAQLASAGWDRAERIEREHRMELAEARLRERSRIAEDMHDSVGHELSLIALRAAALEVDADLPERHRVAATELRQAAATATERLGEIIGVLRDGGPAAPTLPAHESVAELVDRAAASGLDVRLVEEGRAGRAALPPMVDRAVHRVVQEALTNASKYAPGAAVAVTISHQDDDAVLVQVLNSAATRPVPDDVRSGGRGLAGLSERMRLVGGSLTAEQNLDGGFEVVGRMPRTGGRPEPEQAESAGSASADERATVRRTARRGLITAIAAPLVLGAVVGAVALGYYLVVGYNSILEPRQFELLKLGQTRAQVDEMLPPLQMVDPPSGRQPVPAGWVCEFYRPDGPFAITYAYRLCFASDRLVAKDVVQTGSVQPTNEGTPS